MSHPIPTREYGDNELDVENAMERQEMEEEAYREEELAAKREEYGIGH